MLKIEIHIPEGELSVELKKNAAHYSLLVILSRSAYFREPGRAWNGKITEEQKVREITELTKAYYKQPSTPKMITINDGKIVSIRLEEKGSQISLTIKDREEGMPELMLMQKIFDLIDEAIPDPVLKKWTGVFGDRK